MQNLILFDGESREHLLPFTFTRPVADIRIGILTIREKWERKLNLNSSYYTEDYLSEKFPVVIGSDNLMVNACCLPDEHLAKAISSLKLNEALVFDNNLIAVRLDESSTKNYSYSSAMVAKWSLKKLKEAPAMVNHVWDIFRKNEEELKKDFLLLTKNRTSQKISSTNRCINPENIFIESGAKVEYSILNASKGSIYTAKDSEVMEGAMIRGPFALGEHSEVKMGTKIYGATTVGPHCKVGGEINNSVLFGYSNKAHEGYLGNSVIGEWCNLGADTNNSNLKNDYGDVKIWSYSKKQFEDTELQFCGLFLGDHSKTAINTMFNTGTVVGVFSNIFGSGFPRKFIPSFQWGGSSGFEVYKTEKAFAVAELVMSRRNIPFTDQDKKILQCIFEQEIQQKN